MKTILVSLISEQTIPNILAIHHFRPDELLFISTDAMEKKQKTRHILDTLEGLALDYRGQSKTVSVKEDSILDCHRKLDEWIPGREESEFIVNITCGTKIMSIAAYEFFKEYDARVIYTPFPRNEFITPFPKRLTKAEALGVRLTVRDYLSAYGLSVRNGPKLAEMREQAERRKELSEWIVLNYPKLKNLLVWLGGNLRDPREKKRKQFDLKGNFPGASEEEKGLLQQLGFLCNGDSLEKSITRSEILYLTGGWLEEYCFNEVDGFGESGADDVVIGVQISNENGADNEFDVMFTRENALYTVECKSLDQHTDKETDALYKIGALNKDFGLKFKSFFVSTSPYITKGGKIKPSVQARADQFNTTVVTPDNVQHFGLIVAEELRIDSSGGGTNA